MISVYSDPLLSWSGLTHRDMKLGVLSHQYMTTCGGFHTNNDEFDTINDEF